MKCGICNGKLKFENGIYTCESCGNTYQLLSAFINDDVFIAYIENDDFGRRTKDSIIAQEIYQRLQALGVSTFYGKVSAGNLTDNDYNNAVEISITNAKIIIVVGCLAENFQKLLSAYKDLFTNKEIIPVYSQISAYNLPNEISNIQAINYDTVGAVADISNSVLKKIGKLQDVDIIAKAKEKKSIQTKMIGYSLGIVGIIILFISMYIVFGTHYVLDSRKYDYAQKLEMNGSYIEALEIYSDISDYRDASNRINAIYDRYNGYFSKSNDEITLYLNIDKNINSRIMIIQNHNGEIFNIQAESKVQKHRIIFDFKNNIENMGKGTIELLNTGIKLKVNTNENNYATANNFIREYEFSDRKDAPTTKKISSEDVMGWLDKHLSLQDIHKMGIETDYIANLHWEFLFAVYKIKNTDYGVLISGTKSDMESIIGVYIPFEEISPEKKISYIPFNEKKHIYQYYKDEQNILYGCFYSLCGIETDFLESTYFITSKDVMADFWGLMTVDPDEIDVWWEDAINLIS